MMTTTQTAQVKRLKGRPKDPNALVIQAMKIKPLTKEFLRQLENTNRFLNRVIENSPEYKEYKAKKEALEYKKQPSLFDDI